MDHPVLKLKKPVEGCLGITCRVKTWTAHLCVWIILVMVQKVGLLRPYGYAFEWGVDHKILKRRFGLDFDNGNSIVSGVNSWCP